MEVIQQLAHLSTWSHQPQNGVIKLWGLECHRTRSCFCEAGWSVPFTLQGFGMCSGGGKTRWTRRTRGVQNDFGAGRDARDSSLAWNTRLLADSLIAEAQKSGLTVPLKLVMSEAQFYMANMAHILILTLHWSGWAVAGYQPTVKVSSKVLLLFTNRLALRL